MSKHPNEWYLEGLRGRKDEALKSIFEEFLPPIAAYIRKMQGTNEDARDIFQDALEAMFRTSDSLVLTASFFTYLFAVCKRLWFKKLRQKKFVLEVTEEALAVLMETREVDAAVEETEKLVLLRKKFLQLPPDCQRLLFECWHSGKGMEEIAAEIGITYGYARKRRHVCTQNLITSVKSDPLYTELKP